MRPLGIPLLLTLLCAPGTLPAQVPSAAPADTIVHSVVFAGKTVAGLHKTWRDEEGIHFFFEYNDRGRGPGITEQIALDGAGLPVKMSLLGYDYFKNPVTERFTFDGTMASWRESSEEGSSGRRGFYLGFDGTPGELGLLANALLKSPSRRLALLPVGEASIEAAGGVHSLTYSGRTTRVSQYLISGLGFEPVPVWLDEKGELFASGSSWMMTIRKGWESAIPELTSAQTTASGDRLAKLAGELSRKPAGPLVFRNARLFDAESGTVRERMSVVVTGRHITAVGPTGEIPEPANAEIMDLRGKTLMPGLWDMHVHSSDIDGMQHIAAGVTTMRDLANDIDELMARKQRFESGALIGPRVVLGGFMDGPGPFAGPTKILVATEADARAAVDRYAELGFVQIKIYSSIKPELVPAIIDAAHKRGLRVSGHVPANMTADQVVRLGMDELQHANFLFLNFWGDSVKDTRTPLRFTAVADKAASLDLTMPKVRDFIALLKAKRVVVDPTLNAFEGMFTARKGQIAPGYEGVADRLPPVTRRGLLSGGLSVPEGKDSTYRASFAALLKMVKLLHDAGIPLVAGTDAPAGLALHRELELYSMAGIPNSEVLRIATIMAARVHRMDDTLGSIKPGKLADMIVVDGDPVRTMSDIRKVELTMKDGVIHESAKVYRALGVSKQP